MHSHDNDTHKLIGHTMPIQQRQPSYVDCVTKGLSQSERPLTIDELLERIGAERDLGAGARSAVYRAINKLFQAVQVSPGVFGWISCLLRGNVFRHQLSIEETRRGYILLDELEHIVFYPEFFQRYRPENRRITIELFGGPTLYGEAAIERKTWSLRLGSELCRWIDELGGQNGDDLLITVIDAFKGHYAMRLVPHEMRDEASIRRRNMQLARIAEELIVEDRRTRPAVPAWELAAKLIGRGVFAHLPPVDDLHYILHEYSALRLTDGLGYQIEPDSMPAPHAHRFDSNAIPELFGEREGTRHMEQSFNDRRSDEDDESVDFEEYSSSHDDNGYDDGEDCEIYAQYLQIFAEHQRDNQPPLSHEDFHLLEAELELLVRLEIEFGRLLSDQERRKLELADTLFIDPNTISDIDWDLNDGEDYEEPPFWQN